MALVESIWPFMPALVMFLITVGVCALFSFPPRRWPAKRPALQFYWAGSWMFLVAIAGLSGGASTLMLLGVDAVAAVEWAGAVLVPAFSAFVVLGWLHTVGWGLLRGARAAARGLTRKQVTKA